MTSLRLSDLIFPVYRDFHKAYKASLFTDYWIFGGRGGAKSSDISLEIVLTILQDPEANVVCFRRLANTIADSVFAQVGWAIGMLGVAHLFKARKSPFEYTYKPTGQRIVFLGLDDPLKYKSFNFTQGYCKAVWIEEADQIRGIEEIRNIKQTFARKGAHTSFVYSFNPPKSADNWANKYVLSAPRDAFLLKVNYTDVPQGILSDQFYEIASQLKETNTREYNNEYLGEVTGSGGNVFENITTRTITDEEIKTFDYIYNGVDFGWYPDPWAYVRCAYSAKDKTVYIFSEARRVKTGDDETARIIIDQLERDRELVYCDIQKTSIAKYRALGIDAREAKKGAGSVDASMKWLASRNEIVIDPVRCPHTLQEMCAYEYEKDAHGNFVSAYPDKDNHHIDALRYALCRVIERRHNT